MYLPMQFLNTSQQGNYSIVAKGASGGAETAFQIGGCSGATISANITLVQGDMLAIIVGGRGMDSMSVTIRYGAGGGGGSFVFLASYGTSIPTVTAGERLASI